MNLKPISFNAAKTAPVFIKPTVSISKEAVLACLSFLKEHGISFPTTPSIIKGKTIANEDLIEKHYSAHYKNTLLEPSAFTLTDDEQTNFLAHFGLTFDEAKDLGVIKSAYTVLEDYKLSPDELFGAWKKAKAVLKVAGVRFGSVKINNEELIITNGFIPQLLNVYKDDNAFIIFGEASFSMTWAKFRTIIMEMRKMLEENLDKFGIYIDELNNGVHASASPFEAMLERNVWIAKTNMQNLIQNDPFGKMLLEAGIPVKTIINWSKNPFVLLMGIQIPLFDSVEEKDPAEAVEILLTVYSENR